MELSAQVLAVGGTFKMAAARAGCSVRQVKKYYSSADYRARIDELRSTLLSRLRGRIVRELERRTSDEKIQRMELLDLLRVYDRVLGPGKGAGGTHIGEVNVTTNNYDTLLAALVAPDSGTEGVDFPILESTDFPLSGGSSPIEG
jgi:AcrR family transcriptional regulator